MLDVDGQPMLGGDAQEKMGAVHDAFECQPLVEQAIGLAQHDRTIQYRKEGVYELTLERRLLPHIDERIIKLDQANSELGLIADDAYFNCVVGERLLPSGSVRFSPALDGLSLADFPEGATFGNGVTCGTAFRWGNDLVYLSIVVLSDAAALAVEATPATYEVLRQIMET
ncbi:MAG: hypothetical protein IIA92_13735 [Chloroflexi bacterium]|nr:hypothetical protein [Chloroflexota bacterium]